MQNRFFFLVIVFLLSLLEGKAITIDNSIFIDQAERLIVEKKYSQTVDYIDSLFSKGQINENRKLKNRLTSKKADAYYYLNKFETAFELYLKAAIQEELRPENDISFVSNSYGNAADCLFLLGLYEKANEYAFLAYSLAQQVNDSTQIAAITYNIGINYKYLGNYGLALQHLEEAYIIDKMLNDSIGMAYDLNSLAFFFKEWKKYDQSLKYYKESLTIVANANMKKEMATRFGNIAQVYFELNEILDAERNISKAIAIDKEIKDSLGLADHYGLLGAILVKNGRAEQALEYHFQANSIYTKFKVLERITVSNKLIAIAYFTLNQTDKALDWLDTGINIAESNKYFSVLMSLLKLKIDYLNSINEFGEARENETKYRILKDSMFSFENSNKLQKLELSIELGKKEAEIKKLKSESLDSLEEMKAKNQKNSILLVGIISFLALIGFMMIKIKQKKKEKTHQAEVEELQSKLNALLQNNQDKFNLKIKDINEHLEDPLSEREFQILEFVFTRKSNVEIGKELDLSVNTIKFHFKNIFKKFGVKNRKEVLQFLLAA